MSRRCSGASWPSGELREAAVAEALERERVDVRRGVRVAELVVGADPGVAGAVEDHLEALLQPGRLPDPQHPALVRERSVGDPPAVVQLAQQVLARHDDVGEEHLVEVGMVAVHQARERPGVDAGRVHVEQEHADAAVLRCIRIGAHEADAAVGVVRAAGPDLLAVHDEVVVEHLGPGRQRPRGRCPRPARSSRGTPCDRPSTPATPIARAARASRGRRPRGRRSSRPGGSTSARCRAGRAPRSTPSSAPGSRCGRRARAANRARASRRRTGRAATGAPSREGARSTGAARSCRRPWAHWRRATRPARPGTAPCPRRSAGASGRILAGGTLGPWLTNSRAHPSLPTSRPIGRPTARRRRWRSPPPRRRRSPRWPGASPPTRTKTRSSCSTGSPVRAPSVTRTPSSRRCARRLRSSRSTCAPSTRSPTTWRSSCRPRTGCSATTRSSPSCATARRSRRPGYAMSMGVVMGHTILEMDEPEHHRYRALIQQAFTRKAMERWETDARRPDRRRLHRRLRAARPRRPRARAHLPVPGPRDRRHARPARTTTCRSSTAGRSS